MWWEDRAPSAGPNDTASRSAEESVTPDLMPVAVPSRERSALRDLAVVAKGTAILFGLGVVAGLAIRGPLGGPIGRLVDAPARRWAVDHASPAWTHLFRALSALGSAPGVALAGVAVGSCLAWRSRSWRPIAQVAVAYLMASVLTVATKAAVGRVPASGVISGLLGGTFPSGQVLLSAAVFGTVLMLGTRPGSNRVVRAVSTLVVVVVVSGVAVARVYLLAHYLSDVLAGLVLGAGCVVTALAVDRPTRTGITRRIKRSGTVSDGVPPRTGT